MSATLSTSRWLSRKESDRFVLWRSPLGLGPVLFVAVFVMRSVTPRFDIYVPAGRFSVLEIQPDELPNAAERLSMYCTVGEHRTLGMERTLDLEVVRR